MGPIRDARVCIVKPVLKELTQYRDMSYVGRTRVQESSSLQKRAEFLQRRPRIDQMLQDFAHNQDIEVCRRKWKLYRFNVAFDDLIDVLPSYGRRCPIELNADREVGRVLCLH